MLHAWHTIATSAAKGCQGSEGAAKTSHSDTSCLPQPGVAATKNADVGFSEEEEGEETDCVELLQLADVPLVAAETVPQREEIELMTGVPSDLDHEGTWSLSENDVKQ